MGMTAAELRDMESNDVARFEQHMLSTLHRPYLFKLKIAEETYQDETRIKINILRYSTLFLMVLEHYRCKSTLLYLPQSIVY